MKTKITASEAYEIQTAREQQAMYDAHDKRVVTSRDLFIDVDGLLCKGCKCALRASAAGPAEPHAPTCKPPVKRRARRV